ncbi:hypothetical protein HK405_000328, partial [Cladochytrium tenue]
MPTTTTVSDPDAVAFPIEDAEAVDDNDDDALASVSVVADPDAAAAAPDFKLAGADGDGLAGGTRGEDSSSTVVASHDAAAAGGQAAGAVQSAASGGGAGKPPHLDPTFVRVPLARGPFVLVLLSLMCAVFLPALDQ